ncbi:MAG: TetR/AcrR family transcriptional regulator [Acidimicrobiia bacterium]|nr:TetR/AcrR family transcriptional regulator [Acidimicrobiia bacterium]
MDSAEASGAAVSAGMTAGTPPKGGKGHRTRRRLLEIAVRRFAADGFRRTSVSDIARDAGLTPAAAYAYFAGKEALFFAAIDADAASLIERSRRAASGESVRDRWLGFLAQLRVLVDEHPLARRVLAGEESDMVRRLLDLPSLAAVRSDLADDLRAGQVAGEVRDDVSPELLAIGIETLSIAAIMAELQVGPVRQTDRVLGAIAVFDAAMLAPG